MISIYLLFSHLGQRIFSVCNKGHYEPLFFIFFNCNIGERPLQRIEDRGGGVRLRVQNERILIGLFHAEQIATIGSIVRTQENFH